MNPELKTEHDPLKMPCKLCGKISKKGYLIKALGGWQRFCNGEHYKKWSKKNNGGK